jgi:hypothetical protein
MANLDELRAEVNRRLNRVLNQLAYAPMVDVRGVVSPNGVSGGNTPGQDFWSLRIAFEAWRIGNGPISTGKLNVWRKVAHDELKKFQDLIRPGTVIHIRARIANVSPTNGPEALLESFVGRDDSDAELNARAVQLQQPVHYEDPVFGKLTLDRRISIFIGSAVWRGDTVRLYVDAKEPAEVQAALAMAKRLWQAQDDWDQRMRDCAVRELLPLKNENWLMENEAAVSVEEFKQRMKLESISIAPGGSVEFSCADDGMFGEHSIEVNGTITDGPADAHIAG